MWTRARMGVLLGAFLLGILALYGGSVLLRPRAPRMNVVLVICDALRADHVNETCMPFLSGLAKTGLCFRNAVTPCTWTRPAMTSIFTSLYPETHGVYFDHEPGAGRQADAPGESLDMIGSVLKRAGYATIGIQTNGNLGPKFGYGRGYDVYEFLDGALAEAMTEAGLRHVRAVQGRPYFLYLHYLEPHGPYQPPPRYRERFDAMALPDAERAIALDFSAYARDHCAWKIGWKPALEHAPLSAAGQDAVRALYAGEVRYLDDQLRVLVESLPERERTCIIVTADHGEGFWEHDYVTHALTCFGELTQVPLVIVAPGIVAAERAEPVETLSILPTVAALMNLESSREWQGVNLLEAKHTRGRPVFSWTCGPWSGTNIEREMVQLGPWKLVVDRKSGQEMLFDRQADPGEQHDVAGAHADTVASLRKLLTHHRRMAIAARGAREPRRMALDAETARQLEALGYESKGK